MNRFTAAALVTVTATAATVVGVESLAVEHHTHQHETAPGYSGLEFKSRPTPPKPPRTRPPTKKATQRPLPAPRATTPKPRPKADITIRDYALCGAAAGSKRCMDEGKLTMYAGVVLVGHNNLGFQWLSRVPVGRVIRVTTGPLAGTYRVYGHLRINRQDGPLPAFGGAQLVLQSCEGSGTGFSLAHRI